MQSMTTTNTEDLSIKGTLLWSELPDVHKVPVFSDSDAQCLREVRDVLKKYNQLDRLGVALLHKHFELADDEVLLETTDEQKRTQLIRPIKTKELGLRHDVMGTIVKLAENDGDPIYKLRCVCYRSINGHEGRHAFETGL
jgi:hypothetical protein